MIAEKLIRKNLDLTALYKKAEQYCKPVHHPAAFGFPTTFGFCFGDDSNLTITADTDTDGNYRFTHARSYARNNLIEVIA